MLFSDLIDKTQFNTGYYESELERVYYIQSKYLKAGSRVPEVGEAGARKKHHMIRVT